MADSAADVSVGSDGVELSAQDENILNNVDQVLEDCPLDGKPYADDLDLLQKQRALYQCEVGQPRVDDQLGSIAREKRVHPRYRQARENVDALSEKIVEWQAELEEIQAEMVADRETFNEYQSFFDGDQLRSIRLLHRVTQDDEITYFSPAHVLSDRIDGALTLDEKEEGCREKFDNDGDFHRYSEDDHRHPANACDAVYNWRAYMTDYLNQHATHSAQEEHAEIGRMIEVIATDGYTTDGNRARLANLGGERDRLLGFYAQYFEKIDTELDEAIVEQIGTVVEMEPEYNEVLQAAGQEMRWNPSNLHKEQEVRQALDPIFSGTDHTIKAYGVGDADWNIEYAPTGAPVARFHRGAVVTQKQGENFCRIYDYRAGGQYDGTGYTQARVLLNVDRAIYFITACP